MVKINYGRVALGGLAAGLTFVVLQSFAMVTGVVKVGAVLERIPDVPFVPQLTMVLGEIVIGGPAAVWFYAAIRPRFGAGPRTALIAALWVWIISGPYVQAMFLGMGTQQLLSLPRLLLLDVIGALAYRGRYFGRCLALS
jgi:hypothetical protein